MRVVFVHQGDVIEHIFLFLDHALQTIMHDDCNFMRKGRVIGHAIRNRRRQNVAMPIFMLQALAIECRAARGATEQEATRTHVTRSPCQITNALQTEHRVEDIKRNHYPVIGRV